MDDPQGEPSQRSSIAGLTWMDIALMKSENASKTSSSVSSFGTGFINKTRPVGLIWSRPICQSLQISEMIWSFLIFSILSGSMDAYLREKKKPESSTSLNCFFSAWIITRKSSMRPITRCMYASCFVFDVGRYSRPLAFPKSIHFWRVSRNWLDDLPNSFLPLPSASTSFPSINKKYSRDDILRAIPKTAGCPSMSKL